MMKAIFEVFSALLMATSFSVWAAESTNSHVDTLERKEAVSAARKTGLSGPFAISHTEAAAVLKNFDIKAVTAAELADLRALDRYSPLCGPGDEMPMQPCPTGRDARFGILRARDGGCLWSPVYGVPARGNNGRRPIVAVAGLRCGKGSEWDRIQKSALPR